MIASDATPWRWAYLTCARKNATTLSGRGAAREGRASWPNAHGRSLILDEPTTVCISTMSRIAARAAPLRDEGNTIIVIEHNLDVVKTADWIIDLGPGGGAHGGRIVATGTPEQIASNPKSETGKFLATLLKKQATTSNAQAPTAPS